MSPGLSDDNTETARSHSEFRLRTGIVLENQPRSKLDLPVWDARWGPNHTCLWISQPGSWILELRGVQSVKELSSKLKSHSFRDSKLTVNAEIDVHGSGPAQDIPARISESKRSRSLKSLQIKETLQ